MVASVQGAGHHAPGYSYTTYHHPPAPSPKYASHDYSKGPSFASAAHAVPILVKAPVHPAPAYYAPAAPEQKGAAATSYASYSGSIGPVEAKPSVVKIAPAPAPVHHIAHYAIPEPAKAAFAPAYLAPKAQISFEPHAGLSAFASPAHSIPVAHPAVANAAAPAYSGEEHGVDYYVSYYS